MEDKKINSLNPAQNESTAKNSSDSKANTKKMALDDEQRVKVMSPSMLVFKRFIRNKLAIIGTFIIVGMFLFAFLGGFVTPYGESQVFMGYESVSKDFASVTKNSDYRYTAAEGKEFPSAAKAEFILALNQGNTEFSSMGTTYSLSKEGEKLYRISTKEKNPTDVALASAKIFDAYSKDTNFSFAFRLAAEIAMNEGNSSFTADDREYELALEEGLATVYLVENGEKTSYAKISNFVVQPVGDTFLDVEFKSMIEEAIAENKTSVTTTNEAGEEVTYTINRKNEQFTVKVATSTQVIKIYEQPSKKHWLGTDGNGMDILTRLMYGGRISLIIGFIVVAIQITLGILLGGIAGYFGGFIDNLIMRIVDIFYCIPSMPLIIIIGSIMDQMKIDPQLRIYFLMLIMGFLGWPGIARMVRGQILSLREQEFMTATEAMGISIPRRIFKHLIPNVIPQLIVMATMGLGSIILTESTLSFLGLGVKFPFASWGNIISAVSNVHVMTNYWFVWIPAGLCILLTVLAFNFIGDGLRDAFDPKMKR